MSKSDLICGMTRLDAIITASKDTLNLLAEELNEEHMNVLNGVVIHLHNSLEMLDKMEEQFCKEGCPHE